MRPCAATPGESIVLWRRRAVDPRCRGRAPAVHRRVSANARGICVLGPVRQQRECRRANAWPSLHDAGAGHTRLKHHIAASRARGKDASCCRDAVFVHLAHALLHGIKRGTPERLPHLGVLLLHAHTLVGAIRRALAKRHGHCCLVSDSRSLRLSLRDAHCEPDLGGGDCCSRAVPRTSYRAGAVPWSTVQPAGR